VLIVTHKNTKSGWCCPPGQLEIPINEVWIRWPQSSSKTSLMEDVQWCSTRCKVAASNKFRESHLMLTFQSKSSNLYSLPVYKKLLDYHPYIHFFGSFFLSLKNGNPRRILHIRTHKTTSSWRWGYLEMW